MRFFSQCVFVASALVLSAVTDSFSKAQTVIKPPPIRLILPLERAASVDEIVEAIELCNVSLRVGKRSDPSEFVNRRWRVVADMPPNEFGETRAKYYYGNVLDEITHKRIFDACTTKAKLASVDQVKEIQARLMTRLSAEQMNNQPQALAIQNGMVARFGQTIKLKSLVGQNFVLIIDTSLNADNVYLVSTYLPLF